MNVIPITAAEAIMRIREGAHAEANLEDPLVSGLLIEGLRLGTISAGLDEHGRLCFTREEE